MSHASPDRTRRLHLGVFLDGAGHYASAWRHSASPTDRFFQLDYYKQLASTAERGKFDMVFFSDRYGIPDRYGDHFRATVRSLHSAHLDPFTLIAALAGVTEKVGLAANYDLSVHPLDGPVPELHGVTGMQSRLKLIAKLVKSDALTLRQLGKFYGGSRLHRKVVGSPTQIADFMQDWFAAGACDGFNLMPPYLPDGLDKFVELVVPELQNRGLIRTEYEGCTLREHLGLPWPAGRPRF
jgi:alkanesulfonate monooxygenase SsuD/methylene tetrahydromethanopterin reductase-like flavin-dependent oxidoreductase (luciferase family)